MPDVRPIDANALYDQMTKGTKKYLVVEPGTKRIIEYGYHADDVLASIDQALKLDYEPVRHGRWEWYEEPYDSRNPDGDFGWRCSECKADLAAELTLGIPEMHYAYDILDDPDKPPKLMRCVFCGAKMDGGEENGENA